MMTDKRSIKQISNEISEIINNLLEAEKGGIKFSLILSHRLSEPDGVRVSLSTNHDEYKNAIDLMERIVKRRMEVEP